MLSKYYRSLFFDQEGIDCYFDFIKGLNLSGPSLELACGQGDLLKAFPKPVIGLDIDQMMLNYVKDFETICADMRDLSCLNQQFNTIACFGDSLNYLDVLDLKSFFLQIYQLLNNNGYFLFDMHSLDRLIELDGYIEEGIVDDVCYQWTIDVDQNKLNHYFVFYGDEVNEYDSVLQTVFSPEFINDLLREIGFDFIIKTDFNLDGILEGEKYFYICQKRK